MNKDEKSLSKLYEATLSPLNGVGMGPGAEDSAGGLGSPTMTKINIEDEEKNCDAGSDVDMAKAELYKLADYAPKLQEMVDSYDDLEGWVQAKITKASDYVSDVYHYLKYEHSDKQPEIADEVDVDVDVVEVDDAPPGEVDPGEAIKKLMGGI